MTSALMTARYDGGYTVELLSPGRAIVTDRTGNANLVVNTTDGVLVRHAGGRYADAIVRQGRCHMCRERYGAAWSGTCCHMTTADLARAAAEQYQIHHAEPADRGAGQRRKAGSNGGNVAPARIASRLHDSSPPATIIRHRPGASHQPHR